MNKYQHASLETTLDCWEDIFKIPQRFMDKFIYRGQSNCAWALSSSLERSIRKYYPHSADSFLSVFEEKSLIKDFKWKYPLYSKSQPAENDLIEWLTIMQHYGAPTRLLDITKSLFIAVYFALSEHYSGDSAVWAINGIVFRTTVFERYSSLNNVQAASQDELSAYTHQCANDILLQPTAGDGTGTSLFYIEPQLANQRISRQQGAFLMPANIQKSFADHFNAHVSNINPTTIEFKDLINYSIQAKYKQDDITLLKIKIPHELNFEIGKYLRAMNVTAEMLLPGLEGLCKSLSYLRQEGMGNNFEL